MLDLGSDLAKLDEKLIVISQIMFELLENFAKTENNTTGIFNEISEMSKQSSVDGRMYAGNEWFMTNYSKDAMILFSKCLVWRQVLRT